MTTVSGIMYITYVEKLGPFLKVWGQLDRNVPIVIEKSLSELTHQFDGGLFLHAVDALHNGLMCCAKYKDGLYYRARIIDTSKLVHGLVDAHFVDYGNRETIPVSHLRALGNYAPALVNIAAQAKEFVVANATHQGSGWDSDLLTVIGNEIRYKELTFLIVAYTGSHTLITLIRNGEEALSPFFNKGLILHIATSAQQAMLQEMTHAQQIGHSFSALTRVMPVPQTVIMQSSPALLTYKAVSIEPNTENYVYVSYVSDGPCQFSVQLQKLEDTLARLMKELNRMNLQPLEDDPIPGTVCVARCLEDEHICRAVVTSMVDGQYKVFYVDFGNTEVVPLDNLYQIPFKYVIPKVMAMRYALAGLERSSVTVEMKCAFKDFVSDKLLHMRTFPPPSRSALPLCSLWDEKGVNVLDVLRRAALLAYPEAIQLVRGCSQEVRVSFVQSCSRFYVQLKSKEEELRKVMEELQKTCPGANLPLASQVKMGLPCCALFEADGQWYRALILGIEGNNAKVRYVDYGNEERINLNNLRMAHSDQLIALRPQALECCLNGYQNMEDDVERDKILEELILEKEFTMKVVEMQGGRALVDLIDSSRYNVGSLLLERLATARSQVSPLLIQDSHHIDHRKRKTSNEKSSIQQRLERKPMREYNDKGWSPEDKERKIRQDSWRQPKSFGGEQNRNWNNTDKERNLDRQDSWRQSKPMRKEWGTDRNGNDSCDKNERNRGRRDGFRKDSWAGNKERGDEKGGDGFDRMDKGRPKRDNFKRDGWAGNNDNQWKRGEKSSQKEGSEKSWSDGSEKSWRRTQRNFEDKKPRNKFEGGGKRGSTWNSPNSDKGSWTSTKSTTMATVQEPASNDAVFQLFDLSGCSEKVVISWFHSPAHFFCQLKSSQVEFRALMDEIQKYYCNINPDRVPAGAPVVALYPEDNVLYRAYMLEEKGMEYRVQYIDFGNTATTSKIWPIENKFMQLPAQAISCSLNRLKPLDEAWPNPDAFAVYFGKDSFTCNFISSVNNSYSVELFDNDQNVGEAIVAANLACYDDSALGSVVFDPSVLLGQQLRVILSKVEGLDLFYVDLQNGAQLLCTVHNLESATETFEDTLKQNVGSALIMYVDNVFEEKTEVTLYDVTGNKLKIIEPDEGAYNTIEMPNLLPVYYPTITGWVSYLIPVENDSFRIFIQPSEYVNVLAQLLEDLFAHYNNSEEASLQPEIGKIYAVHSSDGNWYRGQVESIENDLFKLNYIDYGNFESVPLLQLRTLIQQFKEQHALALEVLASGVDESLIEQEVMATVWYGENNWEANIQRVDQQAPQTLAVNGDIKAEDTTVIQQNENSVTVTDVEVVTCEKAKDSSQAGVPVILSHVDSPSEFYVQLQEDLDTINDLQATLQEQVRNFSDLENPAAGVLCAAPFSVDQQWYRAQVLDADDEITTVRFVDYGNTDVLNAETHVKTLPSDLLSLEQHARRCSLIVKAVDCDWSQTACERFDALTSVENLLAEIVHQDEKTTYIELYAGAQNIAEVLLQEGLAEKLQLETESSCSGYVSHLNSPSEFWVQLENSVADLEWISEQLSAAESFPELEDCTPGSLCAALFPDDEMWYRARILSNTIAGLEVLFIDYGNSCTCSGLRELPEDLVMLPALAQKCSLQKPPGILQWSSQATEEFRNISADGATIFTIDKFSTGETSVVKLLVDGVDIATRLLAETQDAYVSFFESVSCFWLQKAADKPELEKMANTLSKAGDWQKCDSNQNYDMVAAVCPNAEQWCRAQIVSKSDSAYEVLFVDYGHTATVSDVRVLPGDIETCLPLAVQCKLEPLPGYRWNDESSKRLSEICRDSNTPFQVEFVLAEMVRLYLNGNDIRADLDSMSISSAHSTPRKSFAVKSSSPNATENDSDLAVVNSTLLKDDTIEVKIKKIEGNVQKIAELDGSSCLSETHLNSSLDVEESHSSANISSEHSEEANSDIPSKKEDTDSSKDTNEELAAADIADLAAEKAKIVADGDGCVATSEEKVVPEPLSAGDMTENKSDNEHVANTEEILDRDNYANAEVATACKSEVSVGGHKSSVVAVTDETQHDSTNGIEETTK